MGSIPGEVAVKRAVDSKLAEVTVLVVFVPGIYTCFGVVSGSVSVRSVVASFDFPEPLPAAAAVKEVVCARDLVDAVARQAQRADEVLPGFLPRSIGQLRV